MDKVLTQNVTSTSDFRNDIPGALKRAKRKPFAVLNNNKPSFYVISPEDFEKIADVLFDLQITPLVEARIDSAKTNAVVVDINEL
jgi:antitoxin StbD